MDRGRFICPWTSGSFLTQPSDYLCIISLRRVIAPIIWGIALSDARDRLTDRVTDEWEADRQSDRQSERQTDSDSQREWQREWQTEWFTADRVTDSQWQSERVTDRKSDRQSDWQQTQLQSDTQTECQTDRRTYRQTGTCFNRHTLQLKLRCSLGQCFSCRRFWFNPFAIPLTPPNRCWGGSGN